MSRTDHLIIGLNFAPNKKIPHALEIIGASRPIHPLPYSFPKQARHTVMYDLAMDILNWCQ